MTWKQRKLIWSFRLSAIIDVLTSETFELTAYSSWMGNKVTTKFSKKEILNNKL